jgi:hypothetical protein
MANRSSSDEVTFVHKVFIVVAVCALVGTVWALSDILLLLFGAASVRHRPACDGISKPPTVGAYG